MKGMCTYCGENPVLAKGLCKNCYQRNRRNGTPELHKRGPKFGQRDHQASERKIKVWEEQGRSYTKAAKILGCSRQAVHDAVKRYYKPTNAERIRRMSDEELAQVVRNPCDIVDHYPAGWCKERNCGYKCALEWLKQEATDADPV